MNKLLRTSLLAFYVCPFLPMVQSSIQAQSVSNSLGGRVQSIKFDAESFTIAVTNDSSKDITAFNISIDITYKNGMMGHPQWAVDLATSQTDKKWRLDHRLSVPDPTTSDTLLRPGKVWEQKSLVELVSE